MRWILLLLLLASCTSVIQEPVNINDIQLADDFGPDEPQVIQLQKPVEEPKGEEVIIDPEKELVDDCVYEMKYMWNDVDEAFNKKRIRLSNSRDDESNFKFELSKQYDETLWTTNQRITVNTLRKRAKDCAPLVSPALPNPHYSYLSILSPNTCMQMENKAQRELFNTIGSEFEEKQRTKRDLVDLLCRNI